MMRAYAPEGGRLVRVEPGTSTPVWVDLLDPTREEETAVEALFGIQVPTREEMVEIEESSRLYEDAGAVVMTAVVIDGVSEGRPARTQVTFVLTRERLVTVRYANPVPFRVFEAKCARQPEAHLTAPAIFASLLDSIVERMADVLEGVAGDLNRISMAIFYEPRTVGSNAEQRNHSLQDLLLKLGRENMTVAILRESILSLSRLLPFARVAAPFVKSGPGSRLKAVERDVRSLSTYESQLSTEIGFLQESTLGLINIEQNAIIKVFSIASVLFLPPTLVGTVYGMNFHHMPELDWVFGYPLALVLMVVSAVLPLWWFKRRGWL